MNDFPDFMKSLSNLIPTVSQNTDDIEGYYYEGQDGSQMAFWTCKSDRISRKHQHPFDEYMVVVEGQYIAHIGEKTVILNPGDEIHIPKNTLQWGECRAGTRVICAFGGRRIIKA